MIACIVFAALAVHNRHAKVDVLELTKSWEAQDLKNYTRRGQVYPWLATASFAMYAIGMCFAS